MEGIVLAAADLAPTLPDHIPLKVIRYWEMCEKLGLGLWKELKKDPDFLEKYLNPVMEKV